MNRNSKKASAKMYDKIGHRVAINVVSGPRHRSTTLSFSLACCFGIPGFFNEPLTRENPTHLGGLESILSYSEKHLRTQDFFVCQTMARTLVNLNQDPLPWLTMGKVTVFVVRHPVEQFQSYFTALTKDQELVNQYSDNYADIITDRIINRCGLKEIEEQYLLLGRNTNQPTIVIDSSDYLNHPHRYIQRISSLTDLKQQQGPRDKWPEKNLKNFYNPVSERFNDRQNPWMEVFENSNSLRPVIKRVDETDVDMLQMLGKTRISRINKFIFSDAIPTYTRLVNSVD